MFRSIGFGWNDSMPAMIKTPQKNPGSPTTKIFCMAEVRESATLIPPPRLPLPMMNGYPNTCTYICVYIYIYIYVYLSI